MKKIITPVFLLLLCLSLVPSFLPAYSANSSMQNDATKQLNAAAGSSGAGFSKATDPRLTVAMIIKVILTTLGMVFLCMVIYAGFLYMTAGGNEEHVEKAQKMIYRGIIGLIIIFAAYSITIFAFKVAVNYFQDPRGGGVYYTPSFP